MTVFIIGKPRHGKSSFGRMLAAAMGVKYGETSEVVRVSLANRLGKSMKCLDALPKEHVRAGLVREGDHLCAGNPAYLVERLYDDGCRVIAGGRRKREMETAKRRISRLEGVLTVWVTWPGQESPADNTEVEEADADVEIVNDGTLADLQERADQLAAVITP